MKKILFCAILAALIVVSFVGAGDLIIIDPISNCTDKICFINGTFNFSDDTPIRNITITPFPIPDTTPPVISNVRAEVGSITETSGNISFIAKFANISWETNEPSCSNTVEYGFDINYGTNMSENYCEFYFKGSNSTIIGTFKQNILLTPLLLTSFTEPTTYYYRVWSCDLFGNCAHSDDYSFNVSWKDNQAPIFIGTPVLRPMEVGDSHTFSVQVRDPEGDPITIEWYLDGVLVSSNEFNSTSSSFGVTDKYNFTAISIGTYNFKVVASDGKLNSSFTFNVKVTPEINLTVIPIPFPTPDTIPPVISNVRTMQLCGEGICGPLFVSWDTNEPSYYNSVEYGIGKKYDNVVSQEFNMNLSYSRIPSPSLILELDKPGNYHYRVTSCDMFGNCASSDGYKVKN